MKNEAHVIPPAPDVPKPVRNPLKKGEVGTPTLVPAKPKPDIRIERKNLKRAKLADTRLTEEAHACAAIEYWMPPEGTYEDLLDFSYWQVVAAGIAKYGDFTGSIIQARRRDHSLFVELYVTEISPAGMHVHVLRTVKIGAQVEDIQSEKCRIVWDEAQRGYDIVRKVDGVVLVQAKQMKRLNAVKEWLDKMEM